MEYLPVVSISLTILGIIIGYFGFVIKVLERLTTVETKLEPIINVLVRISVLENKIELFWGVVQKSMTELLHSPHTPEFDLLLEELNDNCINLEKALRLKSLLKDQLGLSDGKKIAVAFLLARVEQIIFSLKQHGS